MGSTRKGMLNVLIAAVLWGSSGVCAQYIMEQSRMSSQFLTMIRLLFAGLILVTFSFMHGDKIFSILKNRKDALSLLIFSVVGALTVQLTFLLTIEKSNAATATVLQFLSPTIIVAWFALARRTRPGILVLTAILTSLIGTFLLVTHGNPTSLSISSAALFWGIASAFAAAFYTTWPSRLIAQYGTLPVVGWSMSFGGLILLPFYAKRRNALCGERQPDSGLFLPGGDRYVADVQPVFERRATDWWPQSQHFKLRGTVKQRPAVATAVGD
ncbi:Permease of the drug/metabolite transporter (DMT) superfamily [Salmonella enterica subsp. enterica]|nr:Permease of the drug/metabolite transporter (DMT) superfamily [Salmonella enterica subsp. enterica]